MSAGESSEPQRRQKQAGDLYLAALDLAPEERQRFLDQACGGDADLVTEVQSLLSTREDPRQFEFTGSPHPQTFGPYRLLQKIGEGGMGEVWLVEQTQPIRRRAALKIIRAGMATRQIVARFESERQALALFDHPTVAKVFEAGSTREDQPYFLMEYVPGVPVTEHCDSHRLPIEERLRLFIQICEGVQHAHERGIIHRDLKPSNILVAIKEGKAVPKIIDFGVAKATAQPLTERTMCTEYGAMIGTPEYMSPEQAGVTAQDIDYRTDIYSLGVILYELLVGALPFEARELRKSGLEGVRKTLREQDPPAPSSRLSTLGDALSQTARNRSAGVTTLTAQVRGDLDWIVMKAIDKDRTRRYASAAELAADIRRYLAREPVTAHPPSVGYRTAKFLRRNVRRHGAVIGLAGCIVAFAFTFLWRSRSPALSEHSIAVLPFENLSADKNEEILSEGLTEELLSALSAAGWRVAPKTSSSWFKGKTADLRVIGQRLNVATVVEGSVREQGSRARIAVRVMKSANGDLLWSGRFDRDVNDILAMQEDIANAVTKALGGTPAAENARADTGPVNAEAYSAYMEGRYFLQRGNEENYKKAAARFATAIKLSPKYVKAWIGLAQARNALAEWGFAPVDAAYAQARAAAERALSLDGHSADAYGVIAHIKMFYDRDWRGSDESFRQALKLEPNNPDVLLAAASLARSLGHVDEASALHTRDLEVDPLNPTAHHNYALTLHFFGRQDEAIAAIHKTMELAPEMAHAHALLSRIYLAESRLPEALAEAERETHPIFRLCGLALAYHALGRKDESDSNLQRLIAAGKDSAPYNIADVYAFRGEPDEAFAWLETAYRLRDTGLLEVKTDPLFQNIRSDPRFVAFLAKMNLPR